MYGNALTGDVTEGTLGSPRREGHALRARCRLCAMAMRHTMTMHTMRHTLLKTRRPCALLRSSRVLFSSAPKPAFEELDTSPSAAAVGVNGFHSDDALAAGTASPSTAAGASAPAATAGAARANGTFPAWIHEDINCLLYTSPSPRDS